MSAVTRKGDKNTGHGSYSAVALNTGSPNVFINGKPCGRKTDTYKSHSTTYGGSHSDSISEGSPTIFVNNLPIARVGDSVSRGGSVKEGSPDVYADEGGKI